MRNLLFLCLLLPALLPAQPDSLYVNGQPFAEVVGPVIEVQFRTFINDFPRVVVQMDYGQDCKGKDLVGCRQLTDAKGDEVRFARTIVAINWLEAQGWRLLTVSEVGDGTRRYFFRRAGTD